jgi:hypothetical protein
MSYQLMKAIQSRKKWTTQLGLESFLRSFETKTQLYFPMLLVRIGCWRMNLT